MSRSKKNRKLKDGAFLRWVSFRSNKKDKTIANRIMRRNNKLLIKLGKDPINRLKEICDIWNFDSDGECSYINFKRKIFFRDAGWSKEDIRKINQK